MSDHPFVMRTYKGSEIEIDVGIAPLIDKLWELGVETTFCCQGDPGTFADGYIAMTREGFLKLFGIIGIEGLLNNTTQIEYGGFRTYQLNSICVRFLNSQLPGLTALVLGDKRDH